MNNQHNYQIQLYFAPYCLFILWSFISDLSRPGTSYCTISAHILAAPSWHHLSPLWVGPTEAQINSSHIDSVTPRRPFQPAKDQSATLVKYNILSVKCLAAKSTNLSQNFGFSIFALQLSNTVESQCWEMSHNVREVVCHRTCSFHTPYLFSL